MTDPLLHTVLIANRGEIALRVIRTCRRLGIRTVAVYTPADVHAPHVAAADDAYPIDDYLSIDSIVAVALEWAGGPDSAIHPGYGFLSENAAFARVVAEQGLRLIGPSAEVMDRMGRKDAAREIAVAAGVPVVPRGEDAGYPILVKAAAGGGGKGMRVVHAESELAEATAAAKREALAAFGDDTMLIEKYVERGRHIEVQVFGDTRGHVVHLGERDCSVQRRHQKVVEEAPAPTITDEVRDLVTSAAVALAAHVGYTGAGTVEFLLDEATGEAYFLEMNTRLQVEHPVTEAVMRVRGEPIDLVELQLRVAAGEQLGFDQADVTVEGHAIEARIYAEDSFGGFLPQAGTASIVRWPAGEGVRVDHALVSGQVVSSAYDPMLGKVIAYGADRGQATQRLVGALQDTAILGLTTNVGFLVALLRRREFYRAEIDTAWLDRETVEPPDHARPVAQDVAAWVKAMLLAAGPAHPFQVDGWRLGADPAPIVVEYDRPIAVDRRRGLVDGRRFVEHSAENHVLRYERADVIWEATVNITRDAAEVVEHGQRHLFRAPDRLARTAAVGDGTVLSPMPGTVLDVRVAAGQEVAEGDVLGVMEAMKMELSLTAPFAGTVTDVAARTGQQVPIGTALFVVEAPPAP